MAESPGWYLDAVPLLLHAVAAAMLALAGVGASRWLGAARGRPGSYVDRSGWALGVGAVALGGLLYALLLDRTGLLEVEPGWTARADGSTLAPLGDLAATEVPYVGGPSNPYLVLVGVPLLALVWSVATVRGARRRTVSAATPPLGVAVQAAGVWVVTLPLQSALCAFEVEGALVLPGAALALVGAVATATGRPTATDVGDVLAATGTWLVAAASWPGGWTYTAPVVVAVLVVVRRRAVAVRA